MDVFGLQGRRLSEIAHSTGDVMEATIQDVPTFGVGVGMGRLQLDDSSEIGHGLWHIKIQIKMGCGNMMGGDANHVGWWCWWCWLVMLVGGDGDIGW